MNTDLESGTHSSNPFDSELQPQSKSTTGGIVVYSINSTLTATSALTSTSTSTSSQSNKFPCIILDEQGVDANCSTLAKETCELVVARIDGLFSFSIEDRGGAAGFEGEKDCICALGRYCNHIILHM